MERGNKNFKVTVVFQDDTTEDLFYYANSHDMAAFLAGLTLGSRGDGYRVKNLVANQIIENPCKY